MELLQKTVELINKCKSMRHTMTKEEMEDLRMDLAINKFQIVEDLFPEITSNRSRAELKMEHEEGVSFNKYYKIASNKVGEDGKRLYTNSVAESIARKAMKNDSTDYYRAKKEYLEAKDEESKIYQLLKSIDQVLNAMSSITKA